MVVIYIIDIYYIAMFFLKKINGLWVIFDGTWESVDKQNNNKVIER